MLVCNQNTKDLFVAAGQGNCGRLPSDASIHHFAYPIQDIVNEVQKITALVGANRNNANGNNQVEQLAYTNDNFDLDKSFTRDAMSSVYAPLIEYSKGVGQAYLYDQDCYKTHHFVFNRGYQFSTRYTVDNQDKSIKLELISNKVIAQGEHVMVNADVKYKVIGITGEERGGELQLSHKFIATDTYTTETRAADTTETEEPCVVTRQQPKHYCLHHRGLPCNNLGMFNTEYCHSSCRCYAEGVGLGNASASGSSSATGTDANANTNSNASDSGGTSVDTVIDSSGYADAESGPGGQSSTTRPTQNPINGTTYYVYSIKLTPAYDADMVDNGLGGEQVTNIIVPEVDARAYSTVPTMIAKGDWIEVEMPNGDVELYVCHMACTSNNKLGCPTYYTYMHADLRHTIHYVLYFPQLSNRANLKAADQQIHDALVDYCCYRWFAITLPAEAEQYYERFLVRLESIKSYLDFAQGGLFYTTPRYV